MGWGAQRGACVSAYRRPQGRSDGRQPHESESAQRSVSRHRKGYRFERDSTHALLGKVCAQERTRVSESGLCAHAWVLLKGNCVLSAVYPGNLRACKPKVVVSREYASMCVCGQCDFKCKALTNSYAKSVLSSWSVREVCVFALGSAMVE